MSVLVLGVGNLLMGDEGVGVHAVWRLQHDPSLSDVTVVDGGTGGLHLLSYLRDYQTVILIDAALDGRPPGTVSVCEPRYPADFPRSLSAHDLGLRDLIEAAALLGPLPRLFLVTVSVGEVHSAGPVLTPPVESALDKTIERVKHVLAGIKSAPSLEPLAGGGG